MAPLIECASCGGLKRASTSRCPHCLAEPTQGSSYLKRTLTAVGLGAIAACGSNQTPADAYGAVCFADVDSGACPAYCAACFETNPAGQDSGPQYVTPTDAYGIDAGITDAGPIDAGLDGGNRDD